MVIISTSTVAVSIQAVSPLLGVGASAARAGARLASRTAVDAPPAEGVMAIEALRWIPPLSRYLGAGMALPRSPQELCQGFEVG